MLFPLAVSQHVLQETDPYPRRRLQPNSVCRIDLNPVCATPASVCKSYPDNVAGILMPRALAGGSGMGDWVLFGEKGGSRTNVRSASWCRS